MIFRKYSDFIDGVSINENLDKAKKYMKDMYVLSTAAKQLDLIDDETKYEIEQGNKRTVTPLDFMKIDAEDRKKLGETMRGISVSEEQLRQLITTNEFKAIREISATVPTPTGEKEYVLDRDTIGWLA